MKELTNWQMIHQCQREDAMDRVDIINVVRTGLGDGESATLTQLRDRGVELGEACLCCLQGKDKRYYNDILTAHGDGALMGMFRVL